MHIKGVTLNFTPIKHKSVMLIIKPLEYIAQCATERNPTITANHVTYYMLKLFNKTIKNKQLNNPSPMLHLSEHDPLKELR